MSAPNWRKEWRPLAIITALFLACFWLPVGNPRFDNAVTESLSLVKWYAREHVLLCLMPAFFIAGAIAVFVSQASVMKYLGAKANKVLAYGVASVSGTILAVCSCTVLPLFAGIYRMGAGLGPATAFLYSGPAINVLAIILTARILGLELGIARTVSAISFSVVIGLLMHFIFRKEELARADAQTDVPQSGDGRPLWKTVVYFALMVGVLVFANWGKPQTDNAVWTAIYSAKWRITSLLALSLAAVVVMWFAVRWWKMFLAVLPPVVLALLFPRQPMIPFAAAVVGLSVVTSTDKGEAGNWFSSTWGYTLQITPLLLFGVLIAGALLGRPEHEGLIPNAWVSAAVGGNSVRANLLASMAGAFMYFATLTEVPIVQGLIGSGMGKGPALALLLAGPALSLPSMLVIRSVIGTKKTAAYISLVIIMATVCGMIYGALWR